MSLIYVESLELYSIYLDEHGDEVYLANGPGFRRLVSFEELDLCALWSQFRSTNGWNNHDGFRFHLKTLTTEPDYVDDVAFCIRCEDPELEEDLSSTADGWACESCLSDFWTCVSCDELYRTTTTTLTDEEVCQGCLESYWSWCDDCEGYYRDSDAGDHTHSGCDCEAPAQQFLVRNDGEEPLANDERVVVVLPAGVITEEGMREIRRYLQRQEGAESLTDLSYNLASIGSTWQTKEGNFTKRLSRYAYKTLILKIPSHVLSQVGCIAREHSTAHSYSIEVTRDLNLSAEDFYQDDSCWWGSYSESRCALKSNGGFGLRAFDNGDTSRVSGRAWVMPLVADGDGEITSPTFETLAPDAFVVFNGYGELSGYTAARIVAHMAGWTYRKIGFSCSPMYVNNSSGYLVAPEEIAEQYTDGNLTLHLDQHSNLFHHERKVLPDVA